MDGAAVQRDFNRDADTLRFWNRLRNPFLRHKERRLADLIARSLPEAGGSLLEVGCGEGSNLLHLRDRLAHTRLTGIDFSLGKAAFASERCPDCHIICGDALHLPIGNEQYDVVLYRDLLHHVNWAREETLREGVRVVKRNGVVIVFESNGRTILNRVFQWLHPAERGMRDSTRARLLALGGRLGRVRIEHVEASFLVRAIGFFLGWSDGFGRLLLGPIYAAARCWEALAERLLPRRFWTYMMMTIRQQ